MERMSLPAAVCSHVRRRTGIGGNGREGRKVKRKEECRAFINNRKVTPVLSVALESEVIMHSWHYDTVIY